MIKHVAAKAPPGWTGKSSQVVVTLECVISPAGEVTDVRVKSGPAEFAQAAVYAARQCKYTPALLEGVPVPVVMTEITTFYHRPAGDLIDTTGGMFGH
jgi:TonB family protein